MTAGELWSRFTGLAENKVLAEAYRRVFTSDAAGVVLADLAVYCRETSSLAEDPRGETPLDPIELAVEEGKRLVFLRIRRLTHLDLNLLANELRDLRPKVQAEINHQMGTVS